MKRTLKLLTALLCALLLLASCSGGPALKYENGIYTDSKTGNAYVHAPAYYEAIAYVEESEIGKLSPKSDVLVYPIRDVDPAKMICTQNYEVLLAKGLELDELWELDLTAAHICKTIELSYAYATVTDAEELAYLVSCYRGETFAGSEIGAGAKKEKYDLKFEASDLPGVYYCLTYWRFTEDVLIYEDIDSPDRFVPTYSVPYTLETYDNGSYYVAYNFGREILYNRTTDTACAIDDTLAVYLDGEGA